MFNLTSVIRESIGNDDNASYAKLAWNIYASGMALAAAEYSLESCSRRVIELGKVFIKGSQDTPKEERAKVFTAGMTAIHGKLVKALLADPRFDITTVPVQRGEGAKQVALVPHISVNSIKDEGAPLTAEYFVPGGTWKSIVSRMGTVWANTDYDTIAAITKQSDVDNPVQGLNQQYAPFKKANKKAKKDTSDNGVMSALFGRVMEQFDMTGEKLSDVPAKTLLEFEAQLTAAFELLTLPRKAS